MRRPDAWWRDKSTTAKVESYTRGSFHLFALIEIAVAGFVPLTSMPRTAGVVVLVLVLVHAGLISLAVSRSLDWVCGTRGKPGGALLLLSAGTAVIAVTALLLAVWGIDLDSQARAEQDRMSAGGAYYLTIVSFGAGTLALGMRGTRQVLTMVCTAGALAAGGALAVGFTPAQALVMGLMITIFSGFVALTSSFSIWLLTVVIELDEARETRTRLAVAEERLRFGRDLHDVLGRNLAVIALKSELAVQLARRERPESVEQMVEVQRIAQESQREVREVVRGYREADLSAELAGAQGVLTAAGITCRVTGSAAGLPPQVQSVLGWVVREATTNVLRHGDAGRCAIGLVREGATVTLTVESDGVAPTAGATGADGATGTGGTGLAGLRERLARVGGTLEAGAAERVGGRVFRVAARVPLTPDGTDGSGGDDGDDGGDGAAASGERDTVGAVGERGAVGADRVSGDARGRRGGATSTPQEATE
ncbi:histidine kinase [Streptomyces sp. NPDC005955]|uniref:sensor histidine kinase n=1 Tax=Streptomyces sp. NPDC005955 TaxID=3364738 RepID=UPI0036CF3A04